jgi:Putative beta-barrel porin-2, OmpL-like. bbp2
MLHALVLTAALDASPSPSPAPTATPTAPPAYSLDGTFSEYSSHTSNVNATGSVDQPFGIDIPDRTDVSNGLLTVTKNAGVIRGSVTAGVYAFPTVGVALNPTNEQNANSTLYGYVPAYDLAYVPNAHVTVEAGQLASLLGQESGFTFQNLDIQRGLVWAAENTFSRGMRLTYTNGKWFGDLGYTDGYYSGNSGRALEGLFGWTPTSSTTWQFGFLIPGANTPPNVTMAVANKREYDLMLTQQWGKLQLLPYALVVESPASAIRGYTSPESALGLVLLANYAFNSTYSIAGRVESFSNNSATSDLSANADLVGYGPGSRATTWTITPAYHPGPFFARAEYSYVSVARFAPGLAFGTAGTVPNQSRFLVEAGVVF